MDGKCWVTIFMAKMEKEISKPRHDIRKVREELFVRSVSSASNGIDDGWLQSGSACLQERERERCHDEGQILINDGLF